MPPLLFRIWEHPTDGTCLLIGSVDPTAGSGIAAAVGSFLLHSGTGRIYAKTGAAATAWAAQAHLSELGGGGPHAAQHAAGGADALTPAAIGAAAASHSHGTAGIDNDAVTYAKMQNVAVATRVLGRKTAGAGDVEELSLSEILDFIGSAAEGDILYRGASVWSRLAKGTALQQLRMNAGATAPEWAMSAGEPWTEITKSADQVVTNNAVLQNDTELKFTAALGDIYHVELLLVYSGSDATGDYRFNFGLPTAHGWHRLIGDNTAADAINNPAPLRIAGVAAFAADYLVGTDAANTKRLLYLDMMIRCAAAGDVQFRFANSAAAAGRTSTTRAGTRLRYRKLA